MKIVADQNIPEVENAFASHGEVSLVDGRKLCTAQLLDADALIVRSVTQVNKELLHGSRVRFVGSATIGMDHIEQDYLREKGIFFTSAPGCNATSAAEYVTAAILHLATMKKIDLAGLTAGIVGFGNVGSRVARRLTALGCQIHVYDPPRQQDLHDREYVDWDTICQCDIVSAHVPLTRSGEYPTYHMFERAFFTSLKPETLFINTSRGAAVDEYALKERIASGNPIDLVLDVWQHEPLIDLELMRHAMIATPHIAGYSREGKYRGLQMVYNAACRFFGLERVWSMQSVLPPLQTELTVSNEEPVQRAMHELVRATYDIVGDDTNLRQLDKMLISERGPYFDGLRKNYPERREFFNYQIRQTQGNKHICAVAEQLGFTILH